MPEFLVHSLLTSPTLTIRDTYCDGSHSSESGEECATATQIVFPYRGVFVRHLGDDQAVAEANQVLFFNAGEGYTVQQGKPTPYHGYYFRILTKQGAAAKGGSRDYLVNGKLSRGFAVVAYPAEYRNSGVMTFVVNQDGIVYQKDLGPSTANLASAMTEYNPDSTWDRQD